MSADISPLSQDGSPHQRICSRQCRQKTTGLMTKQVTRCQKILHRSGTILILLHLIDMKQVSLVLMPLLLGSLVIICAARTNSVERVVDFKTANGTILKGTYFAAAKPGPGVLLFHQSNRTRKSWDDVARQLAATGINALAVDTDPNKTRKQRWPGELAAAFEFLVSQPGVNRDVVGMRGAGVIGVEDSVETARLHPAAVKSLVLLSGETESLDFLRQASPMPDLFVVADDDGYSPGL